MGMIIFVIASGLTLIFGLMDVLNFGHGAFISLGAYVAMAVMLPLAGSLETILVCRHTGDAGAGDAGGDGGDRRDRAGLRARDHPPGVRAAPKAGPHHHGRHDRRRGTHQGDLGPQQIPLTLPGSLKGAILIGEAAIEKYRLLAVAVGLALFLAMLWTLNRTKIGLLIRAGVQDREMVESLGYRISTLFVGVFVAGSALAGLGGVLWGLYQQNITAGMGARRSTC